MKNSLRAGFMFGLGYLLVEDLYGSVKYAIVALDRKYNFEERVRETFGLPEKKKKRSIAKRVKNKIGFTI